DRVWPRLLHSVGLHEMQSGPNPENVELMFHPHRSEESRVGKNMQLENEILTQKRNMLPNSSSRVGVDQSYNILPARHSNHNHCPCHWTGTGRREWSSAAPFSRRDRVWPRLLHSVGLHEMQSGPNPENVELMFHPH